MKSISDDAGRFEEQPDDRARQDELNVRAKAACAVPAAPVEQPAAVRTQPRHDVLEVGCRGRGGSERRRIERPSGHREQSEPEKAASDLETTVVDVLVRDPIAGQMQWRA